MKWFYEQYAKDKNETKLIFEQYSKLKDDGYSAFGGDTRWHYLAHLGDHEALFKAIDEKRCNPSIKNEDDTSIWHFLARSGNYEGLCIAIDEKRFNPSITNCYGDTIWRFLAWSGNYEGLYKAIDEKRCDPSVKNKKGETVWHCLEQSCGGKILCEAYKKYKFDISIVPEKYHCFIDATKIVNIPDTIEVPEDFKCPITKKIMIDPVVTEYGQVYDRRFITLWMETSKNYPFTNQKITTKVLYPDLRLKRDIEKFLETL